MFDTGTQPPVTSNVTITNHTSVDTLTNITTTNITINNITFMNVSTNAINTDAVSIRSLLFQLCWILRYYQEFEPTNTASPLELLINMILIPVQFTTAAWLKINDYTLGQYPLPNDLSTTVSIVSRKQRAMVEPWTVYSFFGIVSFLLMYELGILLWALMVTPNDRMPVISDFPEIDIADKTAQGHAYKMLASNRTDLADEEDSILSDRIGHLSADHTDLISAFKGTTLVANFDHSRQRWQIKEVTKYGSRSLNAFETNDENDRL